MFLAGSCFPLVSELCACYLEGQGELISRFNNGIIKVSMGYRGS